jgi:putative transposase
MSRPALRIEVTTKDQKALRQLLSGGVQQVRVVLRAVALLQLAKGRSAPRVAATVPLTPQAIRKVGHRYQQGGTRTGTLWMRFIFCMEIYWR